MAQQTLPDATNMPSQEGSPSDERHFPTGPRRDDPDKSTGLWGIPKVISTLGVIGAFIVFFGIILNAQLNVIPQAIDRAISSAASESKESRELFREQLEKERSRSERNRDHGDDMIRQIWQKHGENTSKIVEQLKGNGDTLNEIKALLRKP
jgi:hypothetical protein